MLSNTLRLLPLVALALPSSAETADQPGKGESPTFKLLEAGKPPQRLIRYKFTPDRKDSLVLEINSIGTLETRDAKQPELVTPVLKLALSLASTAVSPAGDLSYEYKVDSSEVVPLPGKPTPTTALANETASKIGMALKDSTGSGTVTARGIIHQDEPKAPAKIVDRSARQQLRPFLDQLRGWLYNLAVPLPEEPLGKGAKWEVTQPRIAGVWPVTHTATYTLVDISPGKLTIEVAVKQTARDQKKGGGAGAAPGMTLASLDGDGTGSLTVDVASLLPSMALKSTVVMEILAEGQDPGDKIKMTQKDELKISLKPPAASGQAGESEKK